MPTEATNTSLRQHSHKWEKTTMQEHTKTANQYRINQEIKVLHNKKTKLNELLFKLHLKCADNWQKNLAHHNTIHRL